MGPTGQNRATRGGEETGVSCGGGNRAVGLAVAERPATSAMNDGQASASGRRLAARSEKGETGEVEQRTGEREEENKAMFGQCNEKLDL